MSNNRYFPKSQIAVHWIIALITVFIYVAVWLHEDIPSLKMPLMMVHIYGGVFVFALTVIRLILLVVLKNQAPAINPPLSKMNVGLAHLVKFGLALLFLLIPVVGILARNYFGHDFAVFGIHISSAVEALDEAAQQANRGTGKMLMGVHEFLGNLALFMIFLHAAAGIAHHYVFKDNTLVRMVPHLDKKAK